MADEKSPGSRRSWRPISENPMQLAQVAEMTPVERRIWEAVVRECLRWNGVQDWQTCDLPADGAEKVYLSDLIRYIRVAMEAANGR